MWYVSHLMILMECTSGWISFIQLLFSSVSSTCSCSSYCWNMNSAWIFYKRILLTYRLGRVKSEMLLVHKNTYIFSTSVNAHTKQTLCWICMAYKIYNMYLLLPYVHIYTIHFPFRYFRLTLSYIFRYMYMFFFFKFSSVSS